MTIELHKDAYKEALLSVERYCREHLDEPVGNVTANGLLSFFIEEVGPLIYNRAVEDVQQRLQMRVAELDFEVHEDEFPYWRRRATGGTRPKGR